MNAETVFLVNQHWKEINPVQCGQEKCAPGHSYGPAVRDYYLLHYVLSGTGTFTSHGVTHTLHAGQVFVIRPFERTYYEADKTDPWHYVWIGFEADVILPNVLSEDIFSCPELQSHFITMLDAQAMKTGREAYLCGQIWLLLAALDRHSGQSTPDYVMQAVNWMHTNYADNISLTTLARELNLDRSYFSTLFRKHMGKSPQQYLIDLRLEKAILLMREHHYRAGDAALATGHPDVNSFSRMFKRRYGLSPTAYLKQHPYSGAEDQKDGTF